MKVFFDIGHPAHVHYFKEVIRRLPENGIEVFVTARDKDVTFDLLHSLHIQFKSRGKGKKSSLGKLIYMIYADLFILFHALRFKPDLYLSFSSPYLNQVSWLLRKPSICLNDSEHTDAVHKKITYPFSSLIFTPFCYSNSLGKKQVYFKALMEYVYLNRNYFTPDKGILKKHGIENQPFILIRLVSWTSFHDKANSGISNDMLEDIINRFESEYRIIISTERSIEQRFSKYITTVAPHELHHLVFYSSLILSEGLTLASESCVLGTPAICINSIPITGYLNHSAQSGLLVKSKPNSLISDITKVLSINHSKEFYSSLMSKMTNGFIDLNTSLIQIIREWPVKSDHSEHHMESIQKILE